MAGRGRHAVMPSWYKGPAVKKDGAVPGSLSSSTENKSTPASSNTGPPRQQQPPPSLSSGSSMPSRGQPQPLLRPPHLGGGGGMRSPNQGMPPGPGGMPPGPGGMPPGPGGMPPGPGGMPPGPGGMPPGPGGMPPRQNMPSQQPGMNQPPQQMMNQGPPPPGPVRVDGWAEHKTPEGKVYFFNEISGESTFTKPVAMMSQAERMLPEVVWIEYIKDGKSYFVNSKTDQSVWDEPMEFTMYKERLRALCEGDAPTKESISLERHLAAKKALTECVINLDGSAPDANASKRPVKKKSSRNVELKTVSGALKAPPKAQPTFDSVEDAKKAFRELLVSKNVPGDATWVQAMGMGIARDKRFRALKMVAQKKEALEEYKVWKASVSEVEQEELAKKRDENFINMLDEARDTKKISGKSRAADVCLILEFDKRFRAYDASLHRQRDTLIDNYLHKLYTKHQDELKAKRKQAEADMMNAFTALTEAGKLTPDTKWDDVQVHLETLNDPKVDAVEPRERSRVFIAYKQKLEDDRRAERKKLQREQEELLARSKGQFTLWMRELIMNGLLPLDESWDKIVATGSNWASSSGLVYSFSSVTGDDKYKTLTADLGPDFDPKPEYKTACRELRPLVDSCRRSLRDTLKSSNQHVTMDSTLEKLCEALNKAAHDKSMVSVPMVARATKKETDPTDHASGGAPPPATEDASSATPDQVPTFSFPRYLEEAKGDAPNILTEFKEKFGVGVIVMAHSQLVDDAIEDDRRAKKKIRRKQERFIDLLKEFIYKTEHIGMTWELAKSKIEKDQDYLALTDEAMRVALFEKFMVSFRARKEKKMKGDGAPPSESDKPVTRAPTTNDEGEVLDDGEVEEDDDRRSRKRQKRDGRSHKHDKKKRKRGSRSRSVSSADSRSHKKHASARD